MRKLVRTHREDKHIQHTVSLILDLLLEQQCRCKSKICSGIVDSIKTSLSQNLAS